MSKLAEIAVGRLDLLNLAVLLRSRSENKTGSGGESIVAVVLTRNLKEKLSVTYNKVET